MRAPASATLLILAAGLIVATGAAIALAPGSGSGSPVLVVERLDGGELARLPVADGPVAMSYRNSLYGTIAEERFVVTSSGQLRLVELAADQRAVLEEYYQIDEAAVASPEGDRRRWQAPPADPLLLSELAVAATDLGERTLLVPGHPPLELWRLVDDAAPTVVLRIEGA